MNELKTRGQNQATKGKKLAHTTCSIICICSQKPITCNHLVKTRTKLLVARFLCVCRSMFVLMDVCKSICPLNTNPLRKFPLPKAQGQY